MGEMKVFFRVSLNDQTWGEWLPSEKVLLLQLTGRLQRQHTRAAAAELAALDEVNILRPCVTSSPAISSH